MSRVRVVLVCLLATCAIGAAIPTSASALSFACGRNSRRWGGFSNASCSTAAMSGGDFAIVYFVSYIKVSVCLWLGFGFGLYSDGFCIFPEIGGPYMRFDPEATTKIKGGEYAFKTKVGGVEAEVKCKEMSAKEPEVNGGKEEEGSKEEAHIKAKALEFNGCKVTKPEGGVCEANSVGAGAGTIVTQSVRGELGKNPEGKLEYDFGPVSEEKPVEKFAELEFKGAKCLVKGPLTMSGSMLMGIGPENEEAEKVTLKAEPEKKEFERNSGEKVTAELKISGEKASMKGEASIAETLDSFEIKETEDTELKGDKVPEEPMDIEEEK